MTKNNKKSSNKIISIIVIVISALALILFLNFQLNWDSLTADYRAEVKACQTDSTCVKIAAASYQAFGYVKLVSLIIAGGLPTIYFGVRLLTKTSQNKNKNQQKEN